MSIFRQTAKRELWPPLLLRFLTSQNRTWLILIILGLSKAFVNSGDRVHIVSLIIFL